MPSAESELLSPALCSLFFEKPSITSRVESTISEAVVSLKTANRIFSKLSVASFLRVEKHIIGHLQTNKVKYIAGRVDMIESVDSVKLAKEIQKQFSKADCVANILIEVNIGNEESKSGCDISELDELIYEIAEMQNIKIKGLMTIPPICDENEVRKYFAKMHDKFLSLKEKNIDNVNMDILSMGMSADYEQAVLEGSNIVRVGSAIFGARHYN